MRLARILALGLPIPVLFAVACSSSSSSSGGNGLDAGFDANFTPPDGSSGGDGGTDTDADAAPPPPPSAGGTGAFGIVTVNGKQKMYLPLDVANASGNGVVAVVDVGVAGNGVNGAPALMTDIDLGTNGEHATATGGDASVVIAASTDSKKIWFIDPVTDTLTKTIELDATYGRSGFSGGGGYVTGIAVDSARHRAILSVWNGFAIVDLQTKSITKVIEAAPAENFGFDSAHNRILAPFYDCTASAGGDGGAPSTCDQYKTKDGTAITHGLNVIDLNDETVYTYQDPAAADPTQPLGNEPDSASADPSTGVVAVPSEGNGYTTIVDLSKATFDKATKSVTAPHHQTPVGYEGVAVEPNKHYAFWEAEFSDHIAVGDLTALNAADGPGVMALMPDLPADAGGGGWSNLGDPHGIAVTAAITDGRAVGFVVNNDKRWVARVDLDKVLKLKPDAAATELTGTEVAPAITFLDARTK